jgi:hypothetical protein
MNQKQNHQYHFRSFVIYFILLIIATLITFKARSHQLKKNTDILEDIRLWAVQYGGYSPKQLIGVRMLKEDSYQEQKIKYYQLAPCSSICGELEECAQLCQKKIKDWNDNLAFSKLMVEAYADQRLIGRIGLPMNENLKLVAWPSPNLFALLQGQNQFHQLILIQIPPQALREDQQQGTDTKVPQMRIVAELDLGVYSDFTTKKTVEFKDLDGDQQIDILAPEPTFARLTPKPVLVEMAYRFEKGVLRAAPSLLKGDIPKKEELREYLLKIDPQKNPDQLFTNALKFAFQGHLELADEIIQLSYSQDAEKQSYWNQLKQYLKQSEYWVEPEKKQELQQSKQPDTTINTADNQENQRTVKGNTTPKGKGKTKKPSNIISPID